MMTDENHRPTTNPFLTGIKGRCPRCQQGRLFAGILKLAPRCTVCGLDYSFADPADGPAFFAMTIGCVPSLAFAVWMQLTFEPPLWAHIFTTLPLIVVCSVALLRPLKGWLVCSQYFHKAEEGRIDHAWHRERAAAARTKSGPGT